MENNNNGGINEFYAIPEWVTDVDDLSEHLDSTGFQFNILKSLFGMNKHRHSGTSNLRDSKKMIHYSIKNYLQCIRKENIKATYNDVLIGLINELPEKSREKIMMDLR